MKFLSLTLIMLSATVMSNANSLDPDETPSNSGSKLFDTMTIYVPNLKFTGALPHFEADENLAGDNYSSIKG